MDLALSEEQQLIVDLVRRFVREEVVPLEDTLDPDADSVPLDELERLRGITREMGLYGLDTPPEFGGPDIDMITRTLLRALHINKNVQNHIIAGERNTLRIDGFNYGNSPYHYLNSNIKILVDSIASKGKITNIQRNKLLHKMTEEVGQLVLRDNYLQSQAISLTVDQATDLFDRQIRFIREMEHSGRLDRGVEFLPDEETLQERKQANIGLTRPEISILMAYSKLWLYDVILESDLPDERPQRPEIIPFCPV